MNASNVAASPPPVVLFGYESSTFTLKVRLALRLKQIPYTFITVPSMMPRPLLKDSFGLTYRKIPVLAIGREIYCDTSIICEALEHFFPPNEGYQSLYPKAKDGRDYRGLIRGFVSYWTDRPLFRVTTGLIPASVWRTSFGDDRAKLIGHKLDADKLEKKIPENLGHLDLQLSLLEPLFEGQSGPWMFSTSSPSMADISVYYQLSWGNDIASGKSIYNLTGGGTDNTTSRGTSDVFNAERYPAIYSWYRMVEKYFDSLDSTETKDPPFEDVLGQMKKAPTLGKKSVLLPTPRPAHKELDERTGLVDGALISVAPDDTGRADPTVGELVAISPEEIVIRPEKVEGHEVKVDVRIHFPRVGFTARPVNRSQL